MMTEEWRPIAGAEGLYEISNFGRVKSLRRGKIMSPTDNGNGYRKVCLGRVNGKRQNRYVHRLVADAFLERPDGATEVNHKDFNKANNSAENLEWVTRSGNVQWSIPNMLHARRGRPTNTGEQYITYRNINGYGYYRLTMRGRERDFKTLQDAIRMREVIMSGDKYFNALR